MDRGTPPTVEPIVLRRAAVAQRLGISGWTLTRWVRLGQFPRPIYLTSGSPAVWRVRDIEAFLEKRRVARRAKPVPRGALKNQGREDE